MKRLILGYVPVVLIYGGGILVGSNYGIVAVAGAAAISIALGMSLGRIGVAGITAIFFVLSVVAPVTTLYLIGTNAGMETSFVSIFSEYDWLRVLIPFAAALSTYFVIAAVRRRSAARQNAGPGTDR